MARTIIPFGPQHPVLPEPIHLDLVVEDEKVIEARPSIGFVHRGLEKLVEKKDFNEFVYVAERICGICSFIHGQTYCQGIEAIMGIPVPPRALYLRTVWGELSRIHSHLLWLGLLADGMGFESLFMHSWRVRERVLNIIEATTGGRVIFGTCKVGGVRRDMEAEAIQNALSELETIEREMREIVEVFLNDNSVKKRLRGVGTLSRQQAYDLGCVGPVLRASGVAQDLRQQGYAAYGELKMVPITRTEGDSFALRRIVPIRQSHPAGPGKNPAGRNRGESDRQSQGRSHHADRTAARRGGLLPPGHRRQEFAAVPRPHANLRQSPRHGPASARLRSGRRPGPGPDH